MRSLSFPDTYTQQPLLPFGPTLWSCITTPVSVPSSLETLASSIATGCSTAGSSKIRFL